MTKQQKEYSTIIAKFMNYKFTAGDCVIDDIRCITMPIEDWAKYHSSLDWLLPVIDKIERTEFHGFKTDVVIRTKGCVIDVTGMFKMFGGNYKTTKVEGVFEAVVDYINWFIRLDK